MQLQDTRLTHRLGQALRRPSTLAVLGAGLLAADLLRRLAAWTDATTLGLWVALSLALLALMRARSAARPRETVAVLLPATARPLCDPHLARPAPASGLLRPRIVLFLLIVLALVLLPVLMARGAAL